MPSDNGSKKVIVMGAGLVGSLLSIFLARRGLQVELYESRPNIEVGGNVGHRSINLAIAARGHQALAAVGLADQVLKNTIPMPGRMVHHSDGHLEFQPYGIRPTECLHAHPRSWLNKLLVDTAVQTGKVNVHYGYRAIGMDFHRGRVEMLNVATLEPHFPEGVVFATDGVASAVRDDMIKLPWFEFSQTHHQGDVRFGYKNLEIPPAKDGKWCMEKNALHVWPGATKLFLALPDCNASFAGNLFLPYGGADSWDSVKTPEDGIRILKEHFPDVPGMIPDLREQMANNPIGLLTTIHCSPWHVEGKAVLLGDAAHGMVPFFGQGMNCGFEDAYTMDAIIGRLGFDWPRVFEEFEAQRLENGRAISDMSLENFIEMRLETDNPMVGLRKAVDHVLEKNFPDRYIGRYSLIVHHLVPYKFAQEVGRIQKEILDELCGLLTRAEDVDLKKAEKLIGEKLAHKMEAMAPLLSAV